MTPDRSKLRWRKSSRSSNHGNCVEVAFASGQVLTRDSKNPAGQPLLFGSQAWSTFVVGIRQNRFGGGGGAQ